MSVIEFVPSEKQEQDVFAALDEIDDLEEVVSTQTGTDRVRH